MMLSLRVLSPLVQTRVSGFWIIKELWRVGMRQNKLVGNCLSKRQFFSTFTKFVRVINDDLLSLHLATE